MNLPQEMTAEEYIGLVKAYMPDFHRVACAETEEDLAHGAACVSTRQPN
jgi:hypothetical protein